MADLAPVAVEQEAVLAEAWIAARRDARKRPTAATERAAREAFAAYRAYLLRGTSARAVLSA